jgi:hypothetical protein
MPTCFIHEARAGDFGFVDLGKFPQGATPGCFRAHQLKNEDAFSGCIELEWLFSALRFGRDLTQSHPSLQAWECKATNASLQTFHVSICL